GGLQPEQARPTLARLPQLSDGRVAPGAGSRGGKRQGAHRQACRAEAVGAARPAGTGLRAQPAARRQRLGQRGGDARGRAPRPALSVQAAPAPGRQARAGAGDAGERLAGRRRRRAGAMGRGRALGWGRQRVLLRRRLPQMRLIEGSDGVDPAEDKAPRQLSFVEVDARRETWEYAVLVTSLEAELLTIAQLYRSRGDAENNFDELKNQWSWGGFTTHDVKRCQFMASSPSPPIGGTCSSPWPT